MKIMILAFLNALMINATLNAADINEDLDRPVTPPTNPSEIPCPGAPVQGFSQYYDGNNWIFIKAKDNNDLDPTIIQAN